MQSQDPITATEPPATAAPAPPAQPATPHPTEPMAVSSTPVARRPRGSRLLNIALGGALVLAIAGVAFAVGRFTAPTAASAGNFPNGAGGGQFFRNGQGGGQNGATDGGGAFFGGGATIEGTVQSVSGSTLTLMTASGQTIQIALDGSTTYHAQTDASASDVTTGGKVLVRLNLRGAGGGANGPTASGASTNPTASDVTVVP
jgi:hypothetical protein